MECTQGRYELGRAAAFVDEVSRPEKSYLLLVEYTTCVCAAKIHPNSAVLADFLKKVVKVPKEKLLVLGN